MLHFAVFYFFTSAKSTFFYPLLAYLKFFTSAKSGTFYIDLVEVEIAAFIKNISFSGKKQ
jgi:hypothetical protein